MMNPDPYGTHDEIDDPYFAPVFNAMVDVVEEIASHSNADPDDRPNRTIGQVRIYQSPDGKMRLHLDDLDGILGEAFREMKGYPVNG